MPETTTPGTTIDHRREFPAVQLEMRTARLAAILAAYQAGIGGDGMPAALLRDAAHTAGRLAQDLFAVAARWGIVANEDD